MGMGVGQPDRCGAVWADVHQGGGQVGPFARTGEGGVGRPGVSKGDSQ